MKTISIIICSLFLLLNCKPSDKEISEVRQSAQQNKVQQDTTTNNYTKLRQMALQATQKNLGLHFDDQSTSVYGIVMDWEMGSATATVVSFTTGDASLYLSSGGGFIGGGQHKSVNSASKAFVAEAAKYLDKAAKTDATPLPSADCIKFYLLTNKGIYAGEEKMKNIENETSKWYGLFEEANKVISELRIVSENKTGL